MNTSEQQVMERRYVLPYNWMRLPSSRHWRQKNGIWAVARGLSGALAGTRVLDAGCGDGWYTKLMCEESKTVHGVDYSGKAIEFAKIIVDEAEFKTGSLLSLPYEDTFFDVIFSFQVLEHIEPENLPTAVQELARVLKKEGVCIVSVPTVIRPMSTAHFQHFTVETITKALEPHFVVTEIVGQECYTPVLKVLERILDNRFWLLHRFATWFHKGPYMRMWNKGPASKGHNFVIKAVKR